MWAGVSKGAAVPGWTLDFEWGLLLSLGRGCPGIGLNRCPSQCPELGALETRFGCHFLYKGSAPDVDTWKMHSQGVALRGCHLSTLAVVLVRQCHLCSHTPWLKGNEWCKPVRSGWITGRLYKVVRWVTANCSHFLNGKYIIVSNKNILCTEPPCHCGSCNFLLRWLATDTTWAFPFLLNIFTDAFNVWYVKWLAFNDQQSKNASDCSFGTGYNWAKD